MPEERLAFVAFETKDDRFRAVLSMREFLKGPSEPEDIMEQASGLYKESVRDMRMIVGDIKRLRRRREKTPARKIWTLGDEIFKLTDRLSQLRLQVDGLYEHLVRDLGVKQKWLEKVVILRRYLPSMDMIPESSIWGDFEKGTRKAAERLATGEGDRVRDGTD